MKNWMSCLSADDSAVSFNTQRVNLLAGSWVGMWRNRPLRSRNRCASLGVGVSRGAASTQEGVGREQAAAADVRAMTPGLIRPHLRPQRGRASVFGTGGKGND